MVEVTAAAAVVVADFFAAETVVVLGGEVDEEVPVDDVVGSALVCAV